MVMIAGHSKIDLLPKRKIKEICTVNKYTALEIAQVTPVHSPENKWKKF
jgi:hypothetical protein